MGVTSDHTHAGFGMPVGYTDPLGRPVAHELLGQFVGAAFDGCTSCQDGLLTLLAGDSTTAARLVELACVAIHAAFGGLPASMTDPGEPGPASAEFRRLARAGVDGANDALARECERMSAGQRRAAANTAADVLVGQLHLGAAGRGSPEPDESDGCENCGKPSGGHVYCATCGDAAADHDQP